MNHPLIILCMFFCLIMPAQTIQPNGYYITQKDDTIKAYIKPLDIFNLQHAVNIVTTDSIKRTFQPGEIKGFVFKQFLMPSPIFAVSDSSAKSIKNEWLKIRSCGTRLKTDSSSGWIDDYSTQTKDLYFESISINYTKLFLLVNIGNKQPLKILGYYYYHQASSHSPYHYTITRINLVEKDGKIIVQEPKEKYKNNLWISRCVDDYPLLSKIVKEKKLNKYSDTGPNCELIVNEYNAWRMSENPTDTSLTLKGILDADRNYKPKKIIFWSTLTLIATGAFTLPGLITAVIMDKHPPKEQNLNIPKNCSYCSDKNYLYGYKTRAYYKKSGSIDKGLRIGIYIAPVVICLALVVANIH